MPIPKYRKRTDIAGMPEGHSHVGETERTRMAQQVSEVLPEHASVCQMCGKPAFELRPFGPNHESICEACSELDPEMTEKRWRDLNPNG